MSLGELCYGPHFGKFRQSQSRLVATGSHILCRQRCILDSEQAQILARQVTFIGDRFNFDASRCYKKETVLSSLWSQGCLMPCPTRIVADQHIVFDADSALNRMSLIINQTEQFASKEENKVSLTQRRRQGTRNMFINMGIALLSLLPFRVGLLEYQPSEDCRYQSGYKRAKDPHTGHTFYWCVDSIKTFWALPCDIRDGLLKIVIRIFILAGDESSVNVSIFWFCAGVRKNRVKLLSHHLATDSFL